MQKTIHPQDQVFWYLQRPPVEPLRTPEQADVAIIGGGMAGLSTAQAFLQKGKKVVLLEAYYCGAGASGKSTGFITPNGELGLSDFTKRYGTAGASAIWKRLESGMHLIRNNIEQFGFDCSYIKGDSLIAANTKRSLNGLLAEHNDLNALGYNSTYIKKEDMHTVLGSEGYHGAITYADNFGINAYKYCQGMKETLLQQGVSIYEETPVLSFAKNRVETLHATVTADHIIVCADRFIPSFGTLSKQVYHAQNFVLVSQSLTQEEIRSFFPNKNYMVWDTDLVYNYYRITDNRLLVGGGSMLNTYNTYETHDSRYMYHKLARYIQKKYPRVTIQFEQMWSGLIGISKDIAPIMGFDNNDQSVYYIGAAAGLTVAAGLGLYCADHIIEGADDLKDYFSPYRSFPVGGIVQDVLGSKISFALSNVLNLNVP
jgi:gamma-glutamylputrescine oxidase